MSAPAVTLLGGDVCLSDPGEGTFSVRDGAIQHRWTIAETMARIDDFSERAKDRILTHCKFQVAGSAA